MKSNYLVGIFNDEESLLSAIQRIKDSAYKITEIYTPYPVIEAIEAMGKKSRFAFAAFIFGFLGAVGVLLFLQYTAVWDWPINYGGKPTNSFPSFIVVTLVLTILTITLASLFTFSVRAKVYPGKAFIMPDDRAMDDKFVIVFDMNNIKESPDSLIQVLKEEGAEEVYQKELNPIS
ncbi:MAG TPA: DUF3341 domain-containing protein [Lentimicrobium sp.]|nr:DUF3341 domain-containing protein [Lentimicrobium sp.]